MVCILNLLILKNNRNMFSEELKQLISAALTDGIITEQERMAIKKRAQKESIDPDEIDVYLDSECSIYHKLPRASIQFLFSCNQLVC